MITIFIGTTAINRIELHADIFPDWINWLNQMNRGQYNLIWYIHIDVIPELEHTFAETKEHLAMLINNTIKVVYIRGSSSKGNFLQACKTLSTNIYKSGRLISRPEQSRVIWLEDDWKLNKSTVIPIEDLLHYYSTDRSVINLSFNRNNYIHALAPSISGFTIWDDIFYKAWKEQQTHIDPEHCVGLHVIKHYGKYTNITNCTIINKKVSDLMHEEPYMNYSKSFYTIHNPKLKLLETTKFVDKNTILNVFKNTVIMHRVTSSFCIDGCKYGRNFMEKLKLEKKHKQDEHNLEFYTSTHTPIVENDIIVEDL